MTTKQEEFLRNLTKGNEFLESIFNKTKPVLKTGKDEFELMISDVLTKLEKATALFSPRANIKETKTAFFVELDIPGINKSDIEIFVDKDTLVVTGKRERDLVEAEKYTLIEASYGKFERRFNLPADIEKEYIDGKIENGVLFIEIPKKIEEVKEDNVIKVNIR